MVHPTGAGEGRGLAIPAAGKPVPQSLFSNALRMIRTTASRSSNEAVLRSNRIIRQLGIGRPGAQSTTLPG
jgi:hypothetical protein